MKYHELFETIQSEFNTELAINAIAILVLNLSMKPTYKDLTTPSRYRTKLVDKAKHVLWESDNDVFELSVKIWDAIHEYETRQTMHGLGGCVKKTFKELIDNTK